MYSTHLPQGINQVLEFSLITLGSAVLPHALRALPFILGTSQVLLQGSFGADWQEHSCSCHRDVLEENGALCNPPGSLPCQPFLIPIFQGSAYNLSCYLHSLVDAFHTSFNLILYPHCPTPISCLQASNVHPADFMNLRLHRLLIHLFFFSNVGMFSVNIYFKQ